MCVCEHVVVFLACEGVEREKAVLQVCMQHMFVHEHRVHVCAGGKEEGWVQRLGAYL